MFAGRLLGWTKPDASGQAFRLPSAFPGHGPLHVRSVKMRRMVKGGYRSVTAGINSEEKIATVNNAEELPGSFVKSTSSHSVSSFDRKTGVSAVVKVRKKMRWSLASKIEDRLESFVHGIGRGILLRLISEEFDPATQSGKSIESAVRGRWLQMSENPHTVEYTADFSLPSNFGLPGAILITNHLCKEFYLQDIVVHGFACGPIYFLGNTWIHAHKDNPEPRIIFANRVYVPSKTPAGVADLRREDLLQIRSNGVGVRKLCDRVYDYDMYNDLGNPDKDEELARPVLGGDEMPYPRRCRTGRPPTRTDPLSESRIEKPHPVYVPRDEAFEDIKHDTFAAGKFKALLHTLLPSIAATLADSDIPFDCFSDIDKLYKDGLLLQADKMEESSMGNQVLKNMMKRIFMVGDKLLKYEIPEILKRDRFSWLRDNEFARQTLAGVNPVNIEILKDFPILSKLDPAMYGPPESVLTKELIEQELMGITVKEAIEEKRLFILDFHDLLLPFIDKINSLPSRKAYASRTVFFYTPAGNLRPIAIELSLLPTPSKPSNKRVYTHGHDATSHWTWKLAKAHVCSVDSGVHQLVNHWLRTHAAMEPYIIATHRQLSSMHPIYQLLHPHMRYTLEINALARQSLINGGGIIEACFSPGKFVMELSSAAYKSVWRFDMEALPADLLRRGMAVEDPAMTCGIRLVIEDYPYAADGLLIWSAIKEWVKSYVNHFYSEPSSVVSDLELQAWWDEIKNKGHHDKRNEPWWPHLDTTDDLCHILTIIIWTASGQHAAINFGQYHIGGYMPNRPTLMRRLLPQEDEHDYGMFLADPQKYLLSSLPTQLQATKVMAIQDILSTHSPDEEYLGRTSMGSWTDDPDILKSFRKFSEELERIEQVINDRNKDMRLKNRSGAGILPYELLLPSSGPGATSRGIPNSVSI